MQKWNGPRRQAMTIPKIIVTDYDAELSKGQPMKHNGTNVANDESKSQTDASASNESEEEDRDIIEALTKAHSTNCERHVDEMIASALNAVKIEQCTNESTEKMNQASQTNFSTTDDDMADMEVSHLTSLLESKNKIVPIVNLQRPTASFQVPPPPPGKLPDISDVVKLVPRKKQLTSTDSFDIVPNFQALGEMSFSASESRNGNGVNNLKDRQTERLFGESESDSQYSSSSSADEQPPLYWKLYNNGLSEKSEGESREDINQILNSFHVVDETLDDNVLSTSNNLAKQLI